MTAKSRYDLIEASESGLIICCLDCGEVIQVNGFEFNGDCPGCMSKEEKTEPAEIAA
jgi:Zn finger protein HypA/HybF involved in hydrogenase expression